TAYRPRPTRATRTSSSSAAARPKSARTSTARRSSRRSSCRARSSTWSCVEGPMAELRAAYLIHGDDHGAIAERRARLRALVEREEGGSVEALEGERATPAGLAAELAAMTLAVGRRVILVDGVERWRA